MFDLTALNQWTKERADEFLTRIIASPKLADYMRILTGMKGCEALPIITDDYDELQDGTHCIESEKGDIKIEQRRICVVPLKIHKKFCMQDLEPYFTSQILPPGSTYEDLSPLQNALLDLIKRSNALVIDMALVNGVLGGASPIGSFNLFNGLNAIIAIEIAAGTIPAAQQIAGVMTNPGVMATFRNARMALPVNAWDDPANSSQWIMLCSGQAKQNFIEEYQATMNALWLVNQMQGVNPKVYIPGTNIEVVAVPGLFNSNRAILTRRDNLWMGTDVEGEEDNFEVWRQKETDLIHVKTRFKLGTQIGFPSEIVVIN